MPAKLLINLKIFIWGEVSHNMPKHVWRSKVKDNLETDTGQFTEFKTRLGYTVSLSQKTNKVRD